MCSSSRTSRSPTRSSRAPANDSVGSRGVTGGIVPQPVPHHHGVSRGIARGVEDDAPVGVGVGVADVEDVGRVDVEPAHLTGQVQALDRHLTGTSPPGTCVLDHDGGVLVGTDKA